jgi:hypothetical protein
MKHTLFALQTGKAGFIKTRPTYNIICYLLSDNFFAIAALLCQLFPWTFVPAISDTSAIHAYFSLRYLPGSTVFRPASSTAFPYY